MATKKDTTNDQGLFFKENPSGRYTTGTKAELVGTLKFKPEWFPGAKGNHKASMTIKGDKLLSIELDPAIVTLQIDRSAEGLGLFDVAMLYSDEEEERRSYIQEKEFEELAFKEASALAKQWLNYLPDSVESFKRFSARLISSQIENFSSSLLLKGGYSFDKKTLRAFDDKVILLCNVLIDGEVKYSQYSKEQYIRDQVADAFNRGLCLSLTGHERNALVERFLHESSASAVKTEESALA
jgi:hypothetical protein